MPDLTFTSKGAAQAAGDLNSITEAAAEMERAFKEDARAANELDRAVDRIIKSKDGAAQFNKEIATLTARFKNGKLDVDQYNAAMGRLNNAYVESQGLQNKLKNSMNGLFDLKKITAFIGAYAGVQQAVSLVTAEYQSQLDLIDKAASRQMSVSDSRTLLQQNLPEELRKQGLDATSAIALKTNVSEKFVNQAFAEGFSASGDGDFERVRQAVELAAKVSAAQPENMARVTGTLLDLSKASGSKDSLANLGLFATAARQSRIVNPQMQAKNIPQGILQGTANGLDVGTATALYTSITSAAVDVEGSSSVTAAGVFAGGLRKYGEANNITPEQAMAALRTNPEAAKKFLANLGGEQRFKPVFEQLLMGGKAADLFNQNDAAIPNAAGLRAAGETYSDYSADELYGRGAASRALDQLVEQQNLRRKQLLSTEDRQNLIDALQNNGGSNLGSRGRVLLKSLQDGDIGIDAGDAAEILDEEAKRLRSKKYESTGSAGVGGAGGVTEREATPEEKESAKLLSQISDVLEDIAESSRRTAEKPAAEGGIPGGGF